MNWKVRFHNLSWWLTTVPTVVGAVYLILAAFDIIPPVAENDLVTAIVSVLTVIFSIISGSNDPTTTGLTDSAKAKEYDVPNPEK